MAFNRAILMGRITHDLELKTTPNGINVCSFSIAVDRRYQTKGEEKKTDFFNIVAWRATADFVTRYFRKGSMILVEGELQTRSYTNKNGQNVNIVELVTKFASQAKSKTTHPRPHSRVAIYRRNHQLRQPETITIRSREGHYGV